MDSDIDIIRFEILIPRVMHARLSAIATRERRSHSAEAVVAIARHIVAESNSVLPSGVGSSSAGRGYSGVAGSPSPAIPPSAPAASAAGGSPTEVVS